MSAKRRINKVLTKKSYFCLANRASLKKTLLLYGLLLLSLLPVRAQTGDNPFELTHRLGASAIPQAGPSAVAGENPFDLIAPTLDRPKVRAKAAAAQAERKRWVPKKLGKDSGFVFTAEIIGLLYLTLLITLMRSIFQKSSRAIFSENMLNQLYRERTGGLLTPFLTAYTLFFYNGGLFLFLLLRHYQVPYYYGYWVTLLMCIAAVAIAFLLKHLVLAILGAIYPISKETSMYSFAVMVFAIVLGLLLTPLNLAIAYVPNGADIFIYISFCVTGVIYLLRTFRALSIANKFLIYYKFHFLLYICAIEIAPVLVLIRLITMVQDYI
jgi:hypothetical protein